jgi:hypothetical protein
MKLSSGLFGSASVIIYFAYFSSPISHPLHDKPVLFQIVVYGVRPRTPVSQRFDLPLPILLYILYVEPCLDPLNLLIRKETIHQPVALRRTTINCDDRLCEKMTCVDRHCSGYSGVEIRDFLPAFLDSKVSDLRCTILNKQVHQLVQLVVVNQKHIFFLELLDFFDIL